MVSNLKERKMKLNPPSYVRSTMYALSVAINAFMAVILTGDVEVSIFVLAGVSAYNAVVMLMAGVNVNPDREL